MKAIFIPENLIVNVVPVDENFNIVDDSEIYMDLDNTNSYHYSDLVLCD